MARELRFGVRLTGDSQGARTAMRATESDLDRLQRELRSTRQAAERTDRSFRMWADGMGLVRGALGPLIGAAGVSMLARFSQQALASVAALDEMADIAGINVEQFQELTKAFSDMAGVAEQDTAAALRRFARRLGLARQDTGAAVDTLKRLNITLEQDTTSALDEAVRKLANMEDGADRAAAASELFGEDSGPRLAAALGQGQDALDETIAKLREQGRIIDEETAESARRLNDRYNELADTLNTTLKRAIVNAATQWDRLFNLTEEAQTEALQNQVEILLNRQSRIIENMRRDIPESFKQQLRDEADAIGDQIAELQNRIQARIDAGKGFGGGDGGGGDDGDGGVNININRRNITEEQRLLNPIVDQMGSILTLQDAINANQQLMLDRALWEEMDRDISRTVDTMRMADGTVADLSISLDDAKDSAQDFNDEMQNAITGWASTWSSELANAVVGAEASFDQILQSFTKMLTQMIIQKQIVEPLLGTVFGGSPEGRATGGPVRPGGIYEVAEREPETLYAGGKTYLLMGSQGGVINPPGQGGGGGGTVVNINDYSGEEPQISRRRGRDGREIIDVEIGRSIREGAGRRAIRETFNVQPRTG